MTIMCDNFTYLHNCETSEDGQSLSSSNYDHLKSLPCIPVYHTTNSRTKTPNKVVLVKPNSVIYDLWESSVEDFHPFLHCLPEELHSVSKILKEIDVTDKLELRHYQMILEDVFITSESAELSQSTSDCVQLAIKKLHDFLKYHSGDYAKEITPLYLPDIENKMRLSKNLLIADKDTKLDLTGTQYFHFNISDFPFTAIELCEVLPDSVRPANLLSVCDEIVMDDLSLSDESSLALQLKKTINFIELHEGICSFIIKYISKQVNEHSLKEFIKVCLGKFEITTVTELRTKFVLKNPKKTIGEQEVSFFIASGENTSILYLENFEESEMLDDIHFKVANHLSRVLCLKIDKNMGEEKHTQLREVILKCLGKTTGDSIKKIFKKHYDILVQGDTMPSLTRKAGEKLPEDWHHRLDQDIAYSYKPREYVAYEDKEGQFIVARMVYQIKPVNEIELKREYRICIRESSRTFKDVNVLSLYKFIRRSSAKERPLGDVILSGKAKICDELKLWKISSDLRNSLVLKATKRLFLRWHPEKNIDCVQEAQKIFTYFIIQIQNAEKHKPLDDPTKEESRTAKKFRDHWDRSSEYYRDFCSWNDIAIQHNASMRKEKSCCVFESGDCSSDGPEISIEVYSFPFDNEEVGVNQEEGERWMKQAEKELTIMKFLHKHSSECSGHGYVCFMAHQIAKKALIGGIYTLCGMDKEDLKENSLSVFAHIIESFQLDMTEGILKNANL